MNKNRCRTCLFFNKSFIEEPCCYCNEIFTNSSTSEYIKNTFKCVSCKYESIDKTKYPCYKCKEIKPGMAESEYVPAQENSKITSDNNSKNNANKNYDEHYNTSNHQSIEVMQANMTPEEFIGHLKGNIIKYVLRMGRKDDVKKEAAKIRRYAQWLEQAVNGETIDPRKP